MVRGKSTRTNRWRWLTAIGISMSLLAGILITEGAKAQNNERRPGSPQNSLYKYATDLNAAAEQGRFNDIEERTAETDRALQILAAGTKNNPVVISESQATRDVVMVGVARRLVRGNVPEELAGKRLFKLNLDSLFHDASNAAKLKVLLSAILSDVANSDSRVILIIDPIQSLIGPHAAFDGAASSLLRDAISNGQIQCFGASTDIAFQQNVATQESLAELFTTVNAEEVSSTDAQQTEETNSTKDKTSAEEFAGDNVSPDLRQLIDSPNAPQRVKAILQVSDANSAAVREQLKANGIIISGQMNRFGALVVDMPTKAIAKLADSGNMKYVSLDRSVSGLGHVESTTGTDAMLAQYGNSGLDGTSIGVAVLDSGISSKHQALNGRVVYSRDFTGQGTTEDYYGHGTFVASMIVAPAGSYGGVAPGVKLINFRVLDSLGVGKTSAVLSALDAVLTYRSAYNIRVVNMSLGTDAVDSYKNDAICRAVRRLVDAGIVVVAAAGNDGKDDLNPKVYGRIHSPGNEPSAITVGAANTFGSDSRQDDGIASYSSRGPTRSFYTDLNGAKHHDNLIKPDLAAPGNKIIGASAPGNQIVTDNPDLCVNPNASWNNRYMRLSGTSVSSPIVAGAVAILLEANPKLTPNMIKMILMYTAQPLANFNMLEQGAGELNVEGSVRLAKLVRTDLSSYTRVGSSLLTAPAPTAQSTIAGFTFKWAQGVVFKYDWAKGTDLITKYQGIYGLGVLIGDGVLISDGVLVSDLTMLSSGVLISDNILKSSGITMSDGTVVMVSGVLIGDGVLLSDGVLVGDGVLQADGVLQSNGVLQSDTSALGDNTVCMDPE